MFHSWLCQTAVLLYSLIFNIDAATNIRKSVLSFTTPLSHPVAASYADNESVYSSLYIVSSNQTGLIQQISSFRSNDLTDPNISIELTSTSTTQPTWPMEHISCNNIIGQNTMQCFTFIYPFIYILQQDPDWIVNGNIAWFMSLKIYNVETQQFNSDLGVPPATLNDYYNEAFRPVCMYSTGFEQIVSMGNVNTPFEASQLIAFVYNAHNDTWIKWIYSGFSTYRYNLACAHASTAGYVYLLGGETASGQEVRFGDKCQQSSPICVYMTEVMSYPRSNYYVAVVLDVYLLVYGGTTTEAKETMELYDIKKQSFTDIIQVDPLKMHNFTPLILFDTILTFIGGGDDNGENGVIYYMNLTELFRTDSTTVPCMTVYNRNELGDTKVGDADRSNCTYVDRYILQNVDTIYFEVDTPNEYGFGFYVISAASTYNSFWFWPQSWSKEVDIYHMIYDSPLDVLKLNPSVDETNTVDLEYISTSTNINMLDNHYVFWMTWQPYLSVGFGDVLYNHAFSLGSVSALVYVEDIVICQARYKFHSDTCKLNMTLQNNNQLIVGDRLHLIANWNLLEATSLDFPVKIESNDIIDFKYEMYFNITHCVSCHVPTSDCEDCSEGMQVDNLATYSIDNNSYRISVSSDLEATYPNDYTITLQRVIQNVEFELKLTGNKDIYPGAKLFILASYNETHPPQPNGTFIIHFDEDFSFPNDMLELSIDYYRNLCNIKIENDSNINCSEAVIIPSSMKYKTIRDNEYYFNISSLDSNVIGQKSFIFSRRIQTVSLQLTSSIYLGQIIEVNIAILDEQIYQAQTSILLTNIQYGIDLTINIKYSMNANNITSAINECFIYDPSTESSASCEEGILFKSEDKSIVGGKIRLNYSSTDTLFVKQSQIIIITQCSIGNQLIGSKASSFVCQKCSMNTAGLLGNSKCIDCQNIYGVSCFGSSKMLIHYNYWVKLDDQNSSIISSSCPSGYCCQKLHGCDFITKKLCAYGRDSNTNLCGQCLSGYSEVMMSSTCKKCENNNYYLVCIPMVLSLLFGLLFAFLDQPAEPRNVNFEMNYRKELLKDDLKGCIQCLLKPVLYFYQALILVTFQNGLLSYFDPLLQLFSLTIFEVNTDNNEESGVCFINGLSAMQKILWYLFFPLCMVGWVSIIACINLWIQHRYGKTIPYLKVGLSTVIKVLILLVGNIISVMLKLLACSDIDGELVHFYEGSKLCFDWIWWLALVSISTTIVIWVIIWSKLYHTDEEIRQSSHFMLRCVVKAYNRRQWYWEMILLIRRMLIAFMITFQFIDVSIIQYLLLIFLMICLTVHARYFPFTYTRSNVMESLTLILLGIALGMVAVDFHINHPQITSSIMTVVVILPILLLLGYFIVSMYRFFKSTKDANFEKRMRKLCVRYGIPMTEAQSNPMQCEEDASDEGYCANNPYLLLDDVDDDLL